MKAKIRLPNDFKLLKKEGSLYSNFDKEINFEVLNKLIGQPLAGEYSARNFHGLFWWDDTLGYWCIEIWQKRFFIETHMSENITDLIKEIQNTYGFE